MLPLLSPCTLFLYRGMSYVTDGRCYLHCWWVASLSTFWVDFLLWGGHWGKPVSPCLPVESHAIGWEVFCCFAVLGTIVLDPVFFSRNPICWGNKGFSEFFLFFKRLNVTQACSLTSLGVMLRNPPKFAILRLPNRLPSVSVLQDLKLVSSPSTFLCFSSHHLTHLPFLASWDLSFFPLLFKFLWVEL